MPANAWYDTQAKIDAAYGLLREAANVTDNETLGQVVLDVASIVHELGNYAATYRLDPSAVSVDCYCAQCIVYRLVQSYPDRH
jgi:hypothetical protein